MPKYIRAYELLAARPTRTVRSNVAILIHIWPVPTILKKTLFCVTNTQVVVTHCASNATFSIES